MEDKMVYETTNLKGDGRNITNHPSTDYLPLKSQMIAKLVTPRKMLLFWEVSNIPQTIMERYFHLNFYRLKPVVRIYDVTDLDFTGKNAHHFFEIKIPYQNGHWFIKGLFANRDYVAELGINVSDKEFFPLFRSNIIQTPMMEIPNRTDINYDLIQIKQYEEHPQKRMDYSSMYHLNKREHSNEVNETLNNE